MVPRVATSAPEGFTFDLQRGSEADASASALDGNLIRSPVFCKHGGSLNVFAALLSSTVSVLSKPVDAGRTDSPYL